MIDLVPYHSPDSQYWLGTDALGRSVLARLLEAAWSTCLSVGIATLIAVSIGVAMGSLLALGGNNRFRGVGEALLGFSFAAPLLLLTLLLLAVFGDQLWIFPSVGLFAWGGIALATASSLQRVIDSDFIAASCELGSSRLGAVLRHAAAHVFPTVTSVAVALSVQLFQLSVLLAFIGVGRSGLGTLIREGYQLYPAVWWTWLPATIVAAILLGGAAWIANGDRESR
jgi:peptide/nickel transport system permease protein